MSNSSKWYAVNDPSEIISPALLVYPDRIVQNIKVMIDIADGTSRLRPHIKTYKIAEIIQLQLDFGITKFKCATIPEAQLLADCGAPDILLAMQPVGINIDRLIDLISSYPKTTFSTIVDNTTTIDHLSSKATAKNININVWIDINNGMNRTGVQPDAKAADLCLSIKASGNLIFKGLHVYDGHIHDTDLDQRKQVCDEAFTDVLRLVDQLKEQGIQDFTIVAGGTPTFPIHAQRTELDVELSPGTPLLWDQGYADEFPDLKFLPAAVLLTRVISKPNNNICLDLGHKSVASEMPIPRIKFLDKDYNQIGHSEEHLVATTESADEVQIGEVNYALPIHICPTVIRYNKVLTVENGNISGSWKVAARDH